MKRPDLAARKALLDTVEVGDLVRIKNLTRVVRHVARGRRGDVRSFTFSIRRCSWTKRPYTVMSVYDLYHVPFEIVKKGYGTMRTELEAILQDEVNDIGNRLLTCCDVEGVV